MKYFALLVAIITISVFVKPLFQNGLIAGHDTSAHIVRIQMMAQSLKDGQFPARWVEGPTPGLSHALFNFYPPFFYYFPAILSLAGAPIRDALYITLIIFLSLGWYGMYKFTQSPLAASLFCLTPYRISQIYVRAAYGEFAATSLIPFVFWGIKKHDIRMTAIAVGLIIITHQPTFIIIFPALIAWTIFLWIRDNSRSALITSFLSIGLGLLLVASFVLPMYWEKDLIHTDNLSNNYYDFHQHFATISQLIYSPWGYGISQAGTEDGMSFQLGIFNWFVLGTAIGLVIWKKKYGSTILIFILITAYGFFMATKISLPIWEILSPLSFIQYPWRFLAITTFATSVLAGEVVSVFKLQYIIGGLILTIFFSWQYLAPATYLPVDTYSFNNDSLSGLEPGYFPIQTIQTNSDPSIPLFRVIQGEAEIKSAIEKITLQKFEANAKSPSTIQINTHYFPGWIANIDGVVTIPGYSTPEGNMEITLDKGNHQVTLEFTKTNIRKLGDYLSLTVGAILFFSLFWSKYLGAISAALKKSP